MVFNISYNKIIIKRKLKKFLEEDCSFIDVSSNFIPEEAQNSAKIIAKSTGYLSGLDELKILYKILEISINLRKTDGESFDEGDIIVELNGKTKNILLGERVALNLLTHMSTITTTTKKFVEIIKNSGKNVKIACTRKTLPGLRIFEKKAVSLAGKCVDIHRFSLDDMILLKDTHLRYYSGNIEKLLTEVRKNASFTKKIEIEVEKVGDVLIAAQNGADIIMLDNFTSDQVGDAINLLKMHNLREKVIIEVSGGITPENIIDYLITEPNLISSGFLTQSSSQRVDFSLRFD